MAREVAGMMPTDPAEEPPAPDRLRGSAATYLWWDAESLIDSLPGRLAEVWAREPAPEPAECGPSLSFTTASITPSSTDALIYFFNASPGAPGPAAVDRMFEWESWESASFAGPITASRGGRTPNDNASEELVALARQGAYAAFRDLASCLMPPEEIDACWAGARQRLGLPA